MTSQYCNKCGDTDGYQCSLPGCEFADPVVKPAPMLCPGCNLPMLDGQTFNGAYGCHLDCTDKVREQERRDNPRPPTESDRRRDELKKSIEEVASLATRLEKENGQLRGLLKRIVATYDAKPSMHLIIAEARQVLGQPVSRYSQKAIEAGKTGKVCGK